MKEQPSADPVVDLAGLCNDGPCLEAKNHVWDYLDGELSADDCRRIKEHIESCPPCEQLFSNELRVKEKVARACCEEAPADLKGKVSALVAKMRLDMCGGGK